jgi:DNA polymerase-3 subunit gamma/tau
MQAVPALGWDGNWPQLAAALPLRGVVQQLAQQSELAACGPDPENASTIRFQLRVPVETLRSAGSVDKLASALSEHFGKPVRIDTEVGAVRQTANAQALADKAERQREAEQKMRDDPFVQSLMHEFNAIIVPGSIKPV